MAAGVATAAAPVLCDDVDPVVAGAGAEVWLLSAAPEVGIEDVLGATEGTVLPDEAGDADDEAAVVVADGDAGLAVAE